jgi:hypothetical protein
MAQEAAGRTTDEQHLREKFYERLMSGFFGVITEHLEDLRRLLPHGRQRRDTVLDAIMAAASRGAGSGTYNDSGRRNSTHYHQARGRDC